jgi:hypothetical protein
MENWRGSANRQGRVRPPVRKVTVSGAWFPSARSLGAWPAEAGWRRSFGQSMIGMMEDTCGKCGASLSSTQILYDEHGGVVCEKCLLAAQEALNSQICVSGTLKTAAYSGLVAGIAAFFFNPYWLLTLAAIASGVYVFMSLSDTDKAARLARPGEKVKKAAILGMALGGMASVVQLLRLMGKLAA